MSSDDFAVRHDDEQEYRYHHRDGTSVKVSFDAFENGSMVQAYQYDQTGDRLAYHSFRVNSTDNRYLTHQTGNTDEVPDAVFYAFRSGGWTVPNLGPSAVAPNDQDPLEVQLLDVRDGFSALADDAVTEAQGLYYEAFGRAAEIALVQELTLQQVQAEYPDETPQDVVDRTLEKVKNRKSKQYTNPDIDSFGTIDHVEGLFINAVRPETQNSTKHHDQFVALAEHARDLYAGGMDYDEAWNRAVEARGMPDVTH